MITILHICWGLEVGGKEHFLYQLVNGLDPARFTNRVVTLRRRGPFFERLVAEGHQITCLDKHAGYDPGVIFRLAAVIRACNPDIINAHEYTAVMGSLAAGWVSPACRRSLVASLHGGHLGLPRLKRGVYYRLLRHTDAVVGVAHHLCADAQRRVPVRVPVTCIPYGVDFRRFEQTVDPVKIRTLLGLPMQARLVVMTARLASQKNQACLVRAAARIARRDSTIHVLIVGDGPCRAALESQVRAAGLGDRVHLLGTRLDVVALIQAADVCAFSSRREGLPLAIQEYLAAGRPIVATAIDGVRELVRDGVNGYLVAPDDDAAMSERIMELVGNRALAATMGRAGRLLAEDEFPLTRMILRYGAFYEGLFER